MSGGHDAGVQAAAESPLAGLRARRDQARAKLFLDLRIPRIYPGIGVRYRPLEKSEIDKANTQIADSKATDAEVTAKAVLLSLACVGVFDIGPDGKPAGDPAAWPKFDQDLADMLGLPADCGAVTLVRDLYLTDGDIIAAVADLAEWSAMSERLATEEYEGN